MGGVGEGRWVFKTQAQVTEHVVLVNVAWRKLSGNEPWRFLYSLNRDSTTFATCTCLFSILIAFSFAIFLIFFLHLISLRNSMFYSPRERNKYLAKFCKHPISPFRKITFLFTIFPNFNRKKSFKKFTFFEIFTKNFFLFLNIKICEDKKIFFYSRSIFINKVEIR